MSDEAMDPERERRVVTEGAAAAVEAESARRTRRSFLAGAAAAAAGYGAFRWVDNSAPVGRLQSFLRSTLRVDAAIDRALFDFRGLAPTYPLSRATHLRVNGVIGLDRPLVPDSWRLQLVGVANAAASPHFVRDVTAWEYGYRADPNPAPSDLAPDGKSPPPPQGKPPAAVGKAGSPKAHQSAGEGSAKNAPPAPEKAAAAPFGPSLADRFHRMAEQTSGKRYQGDEEAGPSASSLNIGTPGLLLAMSELERLPRRELITEFKCIEGWSQITQWSGFRLADLLEAFPPAKIDGREPRYLYMETPDGNFYCGYDLAAARHPQSLLVTHMSEQPLSNEHGAPLRLHMPIKYGYKQIKRIGLIAYTDSKPDDYWTKLGYDWYAGL